VCFTEPVRGRIYPSNPIQIYDTATVDVQARIQSREVSLRNAWDVLLSTAGRCVRTMNQDLKTGSSWIGCLSQKNSRGERDSGFRVNDERLREDRATLRYPSTAPLAALLTSFR
jgi:hypothetical protein